MPTTFTTANNRFEQSFTLTKQNGSTLEIPIAGKYVDKNIFLTFNVQSATITAGTATADISINNTDDASKAATNIHSSLTKVTSEPNTGYFIALNASATGNSQVTRAGWIGTNTLASATATAIKYLSISSASATVTTGGSIPVASLATGNSTINGKTKISLTPQSTTNISVPYYATFSVTKAEGSINFTKTVSQQGYLGNNNQISINNITIPAQQTTYYVPIPAASATNAAYGTATINSINIGYDSTNVKFNVAGRANITGTATLTVNQAGWIPKANITGSTTGEATLSTILNRIGLTASTTGGGARKPTISRTTTTASGASNVGSAAATTTAPSSGYFVSVQSAANTTTLTATPAVTSDGYGTTEYYGATNTTATVGAAASDITYIPIASGTGSANSATADVTLVTSDGTAAGVNIFNIIGTKATTEPTTGYYVAFNASGSGSSKVTTAGWFPANAILPTASTNTTKYFPVTKGELSVTGGGLSASTGHASLVADGYYNGSSYDTNDKIVFTTTQTSGYYKITASGYGEVSRADITEEITKAGYLPKDTGASTVIEGTSTSSNTGTAAYYIKKSTLSTTAVTSSNNDQNITVSAGYYPTDRTVKVNKMTTQNPTTSYTYSGMTTYFDASTTSTGVSVIITPRYSNSAGYVAAHSNTNNGGIGYWKIKSSTITSTTTTVATNNVATRGKYTYSAGWVSTSTTLPIATFANTATSGQTYVDISNTTEAPILISEDYLYINKGYTDNLKISLAKLIPDAEGTIAIGAGHILQGYAAYNYAGTLLSGTIPTRSADNISISGNGITIPYGYYSEEFVVHISSGDYKSEVSLSDVSVTPAINLHANATSTYGFTTTAPTSGANGTNFLTLDPTSNAPIYSATGTATITTAGYLSTGNKKSGTTKTVGVNPGTNYYVPIVSPSFSGGALSATTNTNTVTTTPVVTISSVITAGATNYGVTITKPSGTEGTDYLTIDGKGTVSTTGKVTSNVVIKRADIAYSNTAGVIAAHNSTTALVSASTTAVTTVNVTPSITDSFSPLYIPIITPKFGGGGLSKQDFSATATVTLSSGSETNMTVNLGSKNTATYAYYFKVHGETDSITGNTTVTRGRVSYTNEAGVIEAHSGAEILAASSTSPSVTINKGTADTYINIKAASASRSGSATAATPTATRTTATVSGAYNVGNGSATTATPASGNCFVSFTVTAPATTIPLTTTISTSGYLATTSQITGSATANAKTSGTYYINVPKAEVSSSNGTATATGGSASVAVTGISTTSTNTGYKISATATGGSASTTTSTLGISTGYVTADQTLTVAAKSASGANSSTATYIVKGALKAEISNNTAGSAGMSASGFTALTGTATSSYYVSLTTTAGSVVPKASVQTEGYVKSETVTATASVVNVNGNGTKLYIPTNTITGSVVDLTAPKVTVSGTPHGITTTTTATSYYITINGSGTNGSVKGKATAGNTTGIVPAGTTNTSGATTITPNITGSGTNIYIPAAAGSVAMSAGAGTCSYSTGSNVTVSDTDTSGIAVTFKGKGAVSATAKITTAGYIPLNNSFATGTSTNSNEASLTKYITKVKVTPGHYFDVEVPNGSTSEYITFRFTVDDSGNVTVAGPD